MYLEEYGNTGIPGEWMFELDLENIVRCKPGIKGDTCDERTSCGYDDGAMQSIGVIVYRVRGERVGL